MQELSAAQRPLDGEVLQSYDLPAPRSWESLSPRLEVLEAAALLVCQAGRTGVASRRLGVWGAPRSSMSLSLIPLAERLLP